MKITVVAAILKDDCLTLITPEGKYHKLAQGDPRIRPVIDRILPIISTGESIDVDLDQEMKIVNHYAEFERRTNGAVKFFRVLKTKLAGWFGENSLTTSEGTYGKIPDNKPEPQEEVAAVEGEPTTKEQAEAQAAAMVKKQETREQTLQEIVASAPAIEGMVFNTHTLAPELPEGETMVAVVDNQTIVPNVQNLAAQVARSNQMSDSRGLEAFMRLTAGIPRLHSQEDLIQFIGKSDLQIAQNGWVVAYKNLSKTSEPGVFVDPYTKKVKQGVGTRVCMSEKLVDPNRGQDCSNGLHVASRSYLSGYSGDATFLIMLHPADVIAVPKYNTNKMRVCAYIIVGQVSDEDRAAVLANKPITSEAGRRMLAQALDGTHVPITKQVEITGSFGAGLIYTDLDWEGKTVESTAVFEEATNEELGLVDPIDPENPGLTAPHVNPTEVAEEVSKEVTKTVLSRKEQAQALYSAWIDEPSEENMDALVRFKKSAKVSWDKLGVTADAEGKPIKPLDGPTKAEKTLDQLIDEANSAYEDYIDLDEEADPGVVRLTSGKFIAAAKLLEGKLGKEWEDEGWHPDLFFNNTDIFDAQDEIKRLDAEETSRVASQLAGETVKVEPAPTPAAKGPTHRQRIAALIARGPLTIGTAKEILEIKKAAKKGWSVLGVDAEMAHDIEEQANTGPRD